VNALRHYVSPFCYELFRAAQLKQKDAKIAKIPNTLPCMRHPLGLRL